MKERNLNWLPPVHTLTGDQSPNPGTCPDWETNRGPSALQDDTHSTEPHWSALPGVFLYHSFSFNELSFLLFARKKISYSSLLLKDSFSRYSILVWSILFFLLVLWICHPLSLAFKVPAEKCTNNFMETLLHMMRRFSPAVFKIYSLSLTIVPQCIFFVLFIVIPWAS